MPESAKQQPAPSESEAQLYPVFLKLTGRKVLVVGGGNVAWSKLTALVEARAAVTVVAPQILPEIEAMRIPCVRRQVRAKDLQGAWYVVAAAPPEVNRQVERWARKQRVFVNAVDDPLRASCYLGGVVRKGGVTLAISTEGASPALAGMLREALTQLLPDDIARWVDAGQAERTKWNAGHVPYAERRPLLLRVLNDLYRDRHQ